MRITIFRLLAACWLVFTVRSAAAEPPLKLVQRIELPNVSGRIDHLACDSRHARLYIAALGNGTVEVIDLRTGSDTRSLAGLLEPQGVQYIPDLDRLFVTEGGSGDVKAFSVDSFTEVAEFHLGSDADNIRLNPVNKTVVVGFGEGALAELDPATGNVLAKDLLDGHPESFQIDSATDIAYVNVPDADEIEAIDLGTHVKQAAWLNHSAHSNFPMDLDAAHHHLLIGYRRPSMLEVIDIETGKTIDSVNIASDPDDIYLDAKRELVYVSTGAGFVDVLHLDSVGHLRMLAEITTSPGARTSCFDPETARLYVAAPRHGDTPAAILVYQAN